MKRGGVQSGAACSPKPPKTVRGVAPWGKAHLTSSLYVEFRQRKPPRAMHPRASGSRPDA